MDAREIAQRMKDFGLKGVRDESAHFFISPGLLAEFVKSEIAAERVAAELRCANTPVLLDGHHEYTALKVQAMMMDSVSMRSIA